MRKLLYTLMISLSYMTSIAGDFYPVVYDPTTGEMSYGTTNATTNAYFKSINVGNLSITTNGIAVTNRYGWEDLRFPVGVAAPVSANAEVIPDTTENAITFKGTGGIQSTTNLLDDHVYGVAQFPHTWLTNSDVSPHVHFIQKFSDETNNWYMYYRFQPLGQATNSAWTFIGPATNHYVFNGTNIHQMAIFSSITLNGDQSSILDWKLFSDGAAVSNNITFKEFDIHYQIATPTGEIF